MNLYTKQKQTDTEKLTVIKGEREGGKEQLGVQDQQIQTT